MKAEFVPIDDFIKNHSYIDYCEVTIAPNGSVSYSVPSHQEMLINLTCNRYDLSRNELWDIVPVYVNVMEYLIYFSGGYIPCWSCGYYASTLISQKQKESLQALINAGLVKNVILNSGFEHRYKEYCDESAFKKYSRKDNT